MRKGHGEDLATVTLEGLEGSATSPDFISLSEKYKYKEVSSSL